MKNRLIIFLFSIVTGIFFMSGGYGFWQDQLVINTTLLVKPPAALEEKTETETETEEQLSFDSVENALEGNPIQEISVVTESTITTEEVDSNNSIIED